MIKKKKILILKRKIDPYKNKWALPGLRQVKPETIEDTLRRIAVQELDLVIDPKQGILLGQYDGIFPSRQDMSTGYYFKVSSDAPIVFNRAYFSA